MKKTLLILISVLIFGKNQAQIFGPDTVCVEMRYSYTAAIAGAVTYTWSLPNGWYFMSGQGTDSVFVNVNTSVGQICVIGFDSLSTPIDTLCKTTYWGGGSGTGWDAVAVPGPCYWSPSFATIQPNGTGGGPGCAGCSNAIQNPNIVFAVYDAPWPSGVYQGLANGTDPLPPSGLSGFYTYWIYQVDITPGVNNAYLVGGGCGSSATINNVINISQNQYYPPPMAQSPDPVCVGDTVIVYIPMNPGILVYWNFFGNATMLNPTYDVQCTLIVNSNANLSVGFSDQTYPCPFAGYWDVNIITCLAPVANFSSNKNIICEQDCVDYSDQSTGSGTSWQWSFPGSNTPTSTNQNPTNICYNSAGTYDVQLIVCNTQGCDTLLLPNYITVNANPPPANISQSNDTLFSNSTNVSYAWYNSNNPAIVIGTDSVLVVSTTGNYFVVVTNGSGCSSSSTVFSYQGAVPAIAISSSDTTFCEKNCLDFFDLSQNNPSSWHWYFTGASPDTSTAQNPTGICYNVYGNYTIHLVACNINGCDSVTYNSFITVYQTPSQPIVSVSNDTLYCATTNVTYAWYNTLNPGQLLGTNDFYYAPVAGNYFVVVTDTNGCAVSSGTTLITTGINSYNSEMMNAYYQNEIKAIVINNKMVEGKMACSIVNSLGQVIVSKEFNNQIGNLFIPVNEADGLYFLQIKTTQINLGFKFVIQ